MREISLTSIVCRDCGDPSKARSYQLFLWVELSTMVIGKVIMVSAKCQMVFDKNTVKRASSQIEWQIDNVQKIKRRWSHCSCAGLHAI